MSNVQIFLIQNKIKFETANASSYVLEVLRQMKDMDFSVVPTFEEEEEKESSQSSSSSSHSIKKRKRPSRKVKAEDDSSDSPDLSIENPKDIPHVE